MSSPARIGPAERRRLLLAFTVLAGAGSAIAVAASGPVADRTFVVAHAAAQSTMSVVVPLFGILLAGDLHRPRPRSLPGTYAAALVVAAAIAVVGVTLSAVAVAALHAGPEELRWLHAVAAAVGGVLVQALAVVVGVGLGLLVRMRFVAFVASAVVPLGLWWLLGAVPVLGGWRDWLTPYANARHLLSGEMTAVWWLQAGAILAVWGVGLNAWGVRRWRRAAPAQSRR